jgi:hypothetical protein
MKFISPFLALIILTLFISCASSKSKKEAEVKALEFFTNLKNGDEKKLTNLYPGFGEFDSYTNQILQGSIRLWKKIEE